MTRPLTARTVRRIDQSMAWRIRERLNGAFDSCCAITTLNHATDGDISGSRTLIINSGKRYLNAGGRPARLGRARGGVAVYFHFDVRHSLRCEWGIRAAFRSSGEVTQIVEQIVEQNPSGMAVVTPLNG